MSEFKNIKNIWQHQGAESDIPDASLIIQKTEKMRRKLIVKHTVGIVVLLLTFIYISTFLFAYDFALPTTYVGIMVVLVSIVLGVIFQSQLIGIMLPKSDLTADAQGHLQQTLIYKSRLKYFQKKGISIYYILLSIGFGLYIYEFAYRDMTFGIIAFLITMSWVLFSWFYLRKRSIKRISGKIDEQIQSLKNVLSRMTNG